MTAVKVPKRIGRHDALVALGVRDAALQHIIDETGQLLPLLADKDCGLKRVDVDVLATKGYVRRSWNMLGDAVRLTSRGYSYLAAHRGDGRDAELAAETAALDARILALDAEAKSISQTDWMSGQLGRATGIPPVPSADRRGEGALRCRHRTDHAVDSGARTRKVRTAIRPGHSRDRW